MEKKRTDYLIKRIYKLLMNDTGDLIIRLKKIHDPSVYGMCWSWLGVIHIDPRKELLPTLIHEALHMLYPEWCETIVLRSEKSICYKMSDRQYANLLVRFADYLVRIGLADRKETNGNHNRKRKEVPQVRS